MPIFVSAMLEYMRIIKKKKKKKKDKNNNKELCIQAQNIVKIE